MRPDKFPLTSVLRRLGGSLGSRVKAKVCCYRLAALRLQPSREQYCFSCTHSCPGGLKLAVLAYLFMLSQMAALKRRLQSAVACCLFQHGRAGRCTGVAVAPTSDNTRQTACHYHDTGLYSVQRSKPIELSCRILRDEELAQRVRADAATVDPPGSHKGGGGAKGSANPAKGKGGKRPAASGHGPAALSVAGLAASTDTPTILKAVQEAQAAAGQTFQAHKPAAGVASAGETFTAQKAAGGQAALGKAAVGQTQGAGQAIPKAVQPAVKGASSSPPAAVQQAPGAAASAVASAKPQEDWKMLSLEAVQKAKAVSEEALSKAVKAATAAKKVAIVTAKRKFLEVGCIAMPCCRAVQSVLLEHAEALF